MKRILSLDVGDKRVGIAVSDPLGITAQPLFTLDRNKEFWERLGKTIREKDADIILIGLPRQLDGSLGIQAAKTKQFAAKLEKKFKELKIVFWDERLSSAQAESLLLMAGMQRKKRKIHRNTIAATLILQNYLDRHNN